MSEEFKSLLHISPGLTPENISRSLGKWFGEPVAFMHWEYVSETGKGDSYLSEVIRIKIYGDNEQIESKFVQVVLKSIPKNIARRLTFRSHEFFKNEINFYNDVLKHLIDFQATKNLTEPFDNYAKLFLSYSDGVNDVISLEDATIHGFTSAVRQEGIDLAHCKITLRTFAKFHAISFAMKDQMPEKFEEMRNCIFETYYHERLWDWYERFWAKLCHVAIDAVEREYPNTIYVEKVKKFAVPEIYKKMIDAACNTVSTGVFSHGDSWTNNFLYKYVGDVPVDAKMIDFQLTRCASPVLDVSFFIYACTSQDLRLKHYEELMDYYYGILARQIEEMGSDPKKLYSRELFWEEIKKYSFFGLAFSFESTPFIILPPEDAIPMDLVKDGHTIADVGELRQRIRNAFEVMKGERLTLSRVEHHIFKRATVCVEKNGRHTQQFL